MARGRRHLMIDPKRTPLKSTEINRKIRERRIKANSEIINKFKTKGDAGN